MSTVLQIHLTLRNYPIASTKLRLAHVHTRYTSIISLKLQVMNVHKLSNTGGLEALSREINELCSMLT